jgi:hypothetical protein
MAHWAELDENNKVLRVTVGDNNDPAGDEGYSWLVENLGGRWVQTSYNNNFRKHYAGIGYTYDEARDAFIPPKPPFASWTLNEDTLNWEAPIPMPNDGIYFWNEQAQSWDSAEPSVEA